MQIIASNHLFNVEWFALQKNKETQLQCGSFASFYFSNAQHRSGLYNFMAVSSHDKWQSNRRIQTLSISQGTTAAWSVKAPFKVLPCLLWPSQTPGNTPPMSSVHTKIYQVGSLTLREKKCSNRTFNFQKHTQCLVANKIEPSTWY
jgi:hypothetical protein